MTEAGFIHITTAEGTGNPDLVQTDGPGVIRLERHDMAKNIARYYRMTVTPNLFGEWTLQRERGRIGKGGQVRLDLFATATEAMRALHRLKDAKLNRCYVATSMGQWGSVAPLTMREGQASFVAPAENTKGGLG
jgi:predicted DNA-binding WGR domain protein